MGPVANNLLARFGFTRGLGGDHRQQVEDFAAVHHGQTISGVRISILPDVGAKQGSECRVEAQMDGFPPSRHDMQSAQ